MPDDNPSNAGAERCNSGPNTSSSAPSPASSGSLDAITPASVTHSEAVLSRDHLHAQAVRFLTSLRGASPDGASTSEEAKREFLRSKGLGEGEISRAFEDAIRPDEKGIAVVGDADGQSLAKRPQDDVQAFELAAKQFDDPLHAPPPPSATYPRSPLALYYDQQKQQSRAALQQEQQKQRRYQVLLRFFRSLSALLMLGGGVTGVLVALYRAYLLPRLTDSMSARSVILKHHHTLWDELVDRVKAARKASLAPQSAQSGAAGGQGSPGLRSVLKRVSFADEVAKVDDGSSSSGKEGAVAGSAATEKAVVPGTDVVVDTLVEAQEGVKDCAGGETDEDKTTGDVEAVPSRPALPPINLSGPLRSSLASLAATLRADTSASSVGQPIRPTASTSAGTGQMPPAPTVADDDDDAGSDGLDSLDEDDDDDLEFDPFGLTPARSPRSRRGGKKHSPAPYVPPSSGSSQSRAASSLSDSLVSLKARIATEKYRSETGGMFSQPQRVFGADKGSAAEGDEEEKERRKGVEVAQIRAEIRNLKGLLLSRRNFPSHRLNVGSPASS